MRTFNRGDRDFGRRDSNRGGRDFGRPEMHRATCAECGESCEVPFKPTGDKPVFCSNCFKGKEDSNPRSNRSGGRDFNRPRPSFQDKKMFKTICTECGESCEVPFNPSSDKPVLCSSCFETSRNRDRKSGGDNSQFDGQLKAINEKLDKILQSLSLSPSKVSTIKEKVVAKPEVKKKVVKKVEKKVVPKKKVAKKAKK